MALERDLIRSVREMDEHDLRRLLIYARGLLVARHGVDPGASAPRRGAISYRQQLVRCGRESCTRCPHGPYWYAYWRENGRSRSQYVGKDLSKARRAADE